MAPSSLKRLTLGPPIQHPTPPKAGGAGERHWEMDVHFFSITFFFCSSWGPMSFPKLEAASQPLLLVTFGDKVVLSGLAGLELLLLCLLRPGTQNAHFRS